MDIFSVNTRGMDPDEHAYHTEAPYGPGGEWVGDEDGHRAPRRHWNPDAGWEPTDEDEHRSELVGEDDDSGYNWGPTPDPHHIPEGQMGIFHEPLPDYDVEDPSFGEYDKPLNDWEHSNAPVGGEEHRTGAILRQSEQFALRMAGSGNRPEGWKCPECGSDHKAVPDYSECPSCGYDKVQNNNQGICPECDHYEDDWIDDRAPIDHWDDQMWEHDPEEWHLWHRQRQGKVMPPFVRTRMAALDWNNEGGGRYSTTHPDGRELVILQKPGFHGKGIVGYELWHVGEDAGPDQQNLLSTHKRLSEAKAQAEQGANTHLAWGDSTARPRGTRNNALNDGEYFHNLDPALGTTVPEFVDGQPEGAVPIRPMNEAEGSDAFVLKNEQTGLGYDAIVRLSPDGKGFDVLKAL